MTRPWFSDEAADVLTDGSWQLDPKTRIQVWVPTPEIVRDPDTLSPHDVIACPTCHARADEQCRTRHGHRTTAHGNRLVPRCCPCGASLEPRKRLCPPCARENELESRRQHHARTYVRLATVTELGADWDEDEREDVAS